MGESKAWNDLDREIKNPFIYNNHVGEQVFNP